MNPQNPLASGSRRQFLKASATASVAGALASPLFVPPSVRAAGSDTLKVGLVGCGGRGSGAAAQALRADSNVALTAMGDVFEDKLQFSLNNLKKQLPEKVKVNPDSCFIGFDAYKKVVDSGVDVVLLTSPPHFRPMHLKYAVEQGKHAFCEKPVAVDAPGCRTVLEAVKLAEQKKLAIVNGFCWRYSFGEREVFKRINEGQIGDVRNVHSCYNTGFLWSFLRKPEWSDTEYQMRNWLYYTWLSGDHLVEQAVHSVDKLAWAFGDKMPVRAIAYGGRQVRTDPIYGNVFDHFSVVYEYPEEVRGFLNTRQQAGCANGVFDHVTGTKGNAIVNSGKKREIIGEHPWKYDKPENDMYQTEHDELFASIRAGKPINDGVRMTNSTMLAILGRMAAYTGQYVTWEQALNSQEKLGPDTYAWGDLPTPAVAIPGKTRFR